MVLKINKKELNFGTVLYVDGVSGDDTTGDGTIASPYKTVDKALSVIGSGTVATRKAISVLNDTTSTSMDIIFDNQYVDIIGNTNKIVVAGSRSREFRNNAIHNKFYQCHFVMPPNYSGQALFWCHHIGPSTIQFYNCLFDVQNPSPTEVMILNGASGFLQRYDDTRIENCSFMGPGIDKANGTNGFLRLISLWKADITADVTVINCVKIYPSEWLSGRYSPSYGDIKFITNGQGYTFDEDGNILSGDWENLGTGLNPNGTQAHLGVYGGEFAWRTEEIRYAQFNGGNYENLSSDGTSAVIATTNDSTDTIKEAILANGNTIDELNALSQNIKNSFMSKTIVAVSEDEERTEAAFSYKAMPKFSKRLAVPTGYVDLSLADRVKKIKAKHTITTDSGVYVALSNGEHYYGAGLNEIVLSAPPPETPYNHEDIPPEWQEWEMIDKSGDIQKIIDDGIPIEQLENITEEQWETIFPREVEDKKIKFLYAFDIHSTDDVAKVESLELTRDSTGNYLSVNRNEFQQKLYKNKLEIYYTGTTTREELNLIIELGEPTPES